ncbi:MAG: tetratricopeptide repeat protein [Sphingomonas sp.]|nr:tetratricopeptide repeat protein [Sphingomonas sp.]
MSTVTHLNPVKCFILALVVATGSGCDTAATRAASAHAEYQSAVAANDLRGARTALLKLVSAKDDVPDYWIELGRVQIQLQAYGDAYYAFSRAYELKRGDPAILQALMEIALKAGDLIAAKRHAQEIELLSANNPVVQLTYGMIELRRGNPAGALGFANKILEVSPLDSSAIFLKSQALLNSGKPDEAEALLENQLRERPEDGAALHGLSLLYQLRQNWPALVRILRRRMVLNPANLEIGINFVGAALLAGQMAEARVVSHKMLETSSREQTRAILDLWARRWPGHQKILDARRLAARASPEKKIVYAAFFNTLGVPNEALAILPAASDTPMRRENVDMHAAHAHSLALLGRTAAAKKEYDAILKLDGQHAAALAGRAEIELRAGATTAAVYDAQQLIASRPGSSEARLLLARAYGAAGDRRNRERTLRTAFREIPANPELYQALRSHVASTGGPDAARQVEREYQAQRQAKFTREIL